MLKINLYYSSCIRSEKGIPVRFLMFSARFQSSHVNVCSQSKLAPWLFQSCE